MMRLLGVVLLSAHYFLSAQLPAVIAEEVECSTNDGGACADREVVDYLIVGAGGSGIQTALFLKKYGYSFLIIEKEDVAALFWTKFPVFQEFISVNKRVQNETQRFRYDWHSFLDSPLAMWDVSQEYFPSGSDWHEYMNRVVEDAELDVEYGMEVASLAANGSPCVTLIDGTIRCANYRVFVGTGLKERDERYLRVIGGVRYSDIKKEVAVGKRVCIIGNGNAGYEVSYFRYH